MRLLVLGRLELDLVCREPEPSQLAHASAEYLARSPEFRPVIFFPAVLSQQSAVTCPLLVPAAVLRVPVTLDGDYYGEIPLGGFLKAQVCSTMLAGAAIRQLRELLHEGSGKHQYSANH